MVCGAQRRLEGLVMAQWESSLQPEAEASAGVDMSVWLDLPPVTMPADMRTIAVQQPRLSEERITQLITSMRRRAVYPDLRRVKRVPPMERMRNLLADWRAAERRAKGVSQSSPHLDRLRADCDGLRDEYQRLFADRLAHPPGA